MSERPTPRTDSAIMEIPSKFDSICVVRVELALDLERELGEALRERDEAREEWGKASMDAAQLLSEKTKVIAERDEAREELAEAKREAENLAKSIYRSEYSDNDTDWELLDSVAGVISQIDNMYAGVREQRDEARKEVASLRLEAKYHDEADALRKLRERERDECAAMCGRYKQERDIAEQDVANYHHRIIELIDERDKTRQERDEAREQVNRYRYNLDLLPIKWDI